MKANETKIDKFLATNETTFVIPVYQRNYDWKNTECKELLKCPIIKVLVQKFKNHIGKGGIVRDTFHY